MVDKVKSKMSNDIEEDANTRVQPDMKKKASAKSDGSTTQELTSVINTADLGAAGYIIMDAVDNGTGEIALQNGSKIVAYKDAQGYHASVVDSSDNITVDPLLFTASGNGLAENSTIKAFEIIDGSLSISMVDSDDLSRNVEIFSYEFYRSDQFMQMYSDNYDDLYREYFDSYYRQLYEEHRIWYMPHLVSEYIAQGFDEETANSMALLSIGDLVDHDARYYLDDLAFSSTVNSSDKFIQTFANNYTSFSVTANTTPVGTDLTLRSAEALTNLADNRLLNDRYNQSSGTGPGTLDYDPLKRPLSNNTTSLGIGDMSGMQSMNPLDKAFSQAIFGQGALSPESMLLRYAPEGDASILLNRIISDPTADQKAILEAAESLIADIAKIAEAIGEANALELSKAESDLLQMVAAVLLAQGVPDLLKEGDIEGVKGIFKDLGASKDKIMLDYANSIKPYYDNIIKDLGSNMDALQLKGLLSKKLTEEELRNLEPKEIDKILEDIRRSNEKSFELQYILQQDAKYRKEYLDPQNKALEEAMKTMMGSFTSRLNKVLEDKK